MVYLEKRNANLALGEKQMASRSFRVFGTRTDLESVFYEFQKLNLVKYYNVVEMRIKSMILLKLFILVFLSMEVT